jgi:polysaccharide chain length determinant protein (PEP-CTERM system associated)
MGVPAPGSAFPQQGAKRRKELIDMLPGRQLTPTLIASVAWRHHWLIAGALVAGVYGGLVVSSQLKDMYQSEMLIQVVPQGIPDAYVRSTVTMRTEDRINALSQQVMSRTALERLIEEMNLYPEERALQPMQDVVERMRGVVKVAVVTSQQSGETDAFYVRYTYADPEIATRVTERLGGLFIDLNARDRGNLAESTSDFLKTQLADARRKLEEQELRLEQFRQRNAGRLPSQLSFNMQAIQSTQLAVQAHVESLARDRDRKLMLERLNNDYQVESATVVPPSVPLAGQQQTSEPPTPAGLTAQQRLVLAREALQNLRLRLTPEHPDIARANRLIEELDKRVADEAAQAALGTDIPASPLALTPEQRARQERTQQMRAEIDSLARQITFKEAEEQRLRATLADYASRIEAVPGVESEWIALTRDYETQQASYKDLLTKSEQSQVAVELERRQIGEQFRVLDPARPPVRPVGVRRLQVNAIASFAGLALGLALAALLELRDTTFRSGDEVLDVLQLPLLASVPYVMIDQDRQRVKRQRRLNSAALVVMAAAGGYGIWALRLWNYVS